MRLLINRSFYSFIMAGKELTNYYQKHMHMVFFDLFFSKINNHLRKDNQRVNIYYLW